MFRSKPSLTKEIIIQLILLVIFGIFEVRACNRRQSAQLSAPVVTAADTASASSTPLVGLEIPRITEPRTEQIITHLGYTVSYNEDWHLPNWVAYELTADEVDGVEERSNKFLPDPLVNGDPVVTDDYKNSGYDRGHMAPAADMKWSPQAMTESFYMTNMCPQNHNLNAGDWKVLEERIRSWAHDYDHIYICCGAIVSDTTQTIGVMHRIVVPQAFYKVVLRQQGDSWTGLGFMMANRPRDGKWGLDHYAMSIEDLEIVTHIDFFPQLNDSIEEIVEQSFSLSDWGL